MEEDACKNCMQIRVQCMQEFAYIVHEFGNYVVNTSIENMYKSVFVPLPKGPSYIHK